MAALTSLERDDLKHALTELAARLDDRPAVLAVLQRIAATAECLDEVGTDWHEQAVHLADTFGMTPLDEPPAAAFSWDGSRVRTATEPAVLLHEVAHFQLASPARRALPDFGLGAGPESGRVALADAARVVADGPREREEQAASLLGILWEVELGQPGVLAFHEQNWLEGAARPSTADFMAETLDRLHLKGLVDRDYRPVLALNLLPDA
jgi:hypothetical protein